jgi:hypothetical protein
VVGRSSRKAPTDDPARRTYRVPSGPREAACAGLRKHAVVDTFIHKNVAPPRVAPRHARSLITTQICGVVSETPERLWEKSPAADPQGREGINDDVS